MENILYFDIKSGISGDMTIASLLDLGLDQDEFLKELKKLKLPGYQIEISTVEKNGITAADFKVILADESHPDLKAASELKAADKVDSHDHHHDHHEGGCNGCGNHAEHHPEQSQHQNDHSHRDSDHNHSHGEIDSQAQKSGHHHRNFEDIKKLINQSDLNQKVKDLSIEIFAEVAKAEAEVHNKDLNEVHFHEVGAVDSIVDIVGTAILIDILNPDHIYASAIPLGSGFVDVAHGRIPVPAPATIEILRGIPVYAAEVKSELVTPTGAAVIKILAEKFIPLPELEIEKIGYGAGKKDLAVTNLLRLYQAKKKEKRNY